MPDIDSPIVMDVGLHEPAPAVPGVLSARHELFCEKYLETFSVKLAAESVGISVQTGHSWLKSNEDVKAYLGLRKEQIADHFGVRQEWIIGNWVEMVNRGMGRVGGFEADHGVALKASELLAKNLGMFEQTLNINHNIIPQMVIERYEDADYREVEALIGGTKEQS